MHEWSTLSRTRLACVQPDCLRLPRLPCWQSVDREKSLGTRPDISTALLPLTSSAGLPGPRKGVDEPSRERVFGIVVRKFRKLTGRGGGVRERSVARLGSVAKRAAPSRCALRFAIRAGNGLRRAIFCSFFFGLSLLVSPAWLDCCKDADVRRPLRSARDKASGGGVRGGGASGERCQERARVSTG